MTSAKARTYFSSTESVLEQRGMMSMLLVLHSVDPAIGRHI